MQKTLIIGPYTWHNIPGHLIVEAADVAPSDWANQRDQSGKPLLKPKTIDELKQQFGGMQGYLAHPFNNQKFSFDLTPWLHLDGKRYLRFDWKFQPEHPIPPTDPRYPAPSNP